MNGIGYGLEGKLFLKLCECFLFFCRFIFCGYLVQCREEGFGIAGGVEYAAGSVSGHHPEGEDISQDGDAATGHGFADGYSAAFVMGA